MPVAPSNAYLKTKVVTASPAELRLMLLDGAIRFAEQARAGYEQRNLESALEGTTKCQAILTELMCSLRPERNAELCNRLAALYTFMYRRMVEASMSKSAEIAQEVIGLLQYDRETWGLLMEQMSGGGSRQTDAEAPATAPTMGDADPKPRVSLKG